MFLNEEESAAIVDRAMELGINFFDTADAYSDGDSERFLGTAFSEYDREEVVVATKGYYGAGDAPRTGIDSPGRRSITSLRGASTGWVWTRSICTRPTPRITVRRSRRRYAR